MGGKISVVAVVGNPRPGSHTIGVTERAQHAVVTALRRQVQVAEIVEVPLVDLAGLSRYLLTDPEAEPVTKAIRTVASADVLVIASPTYKGSYTGLLKVFVDLLPNTVLAGRAALPVMVSASERHTLAAEVHLRPLLVELGATVPTPALTLTESQLPNSDELIAEWADIVVRRIGYRAPLVNAGH